MQGRRKPFTTTGTSRAGIMIVLRRQWGCFYASATISTPGFRGPAKNDGQTTPGAHRQNHQLSRPHQTFRLARLFPRQSLMAATGTKRTFLSHILKRKKSEKMGPRHLTGMRNSLLRSLSCLGSLARTGSLPRNHLPRPLYIIFEYRSFIPPGDILEFSRRRWNQTNLRPYQLFVATPRYLQP